MAEKISKKELDYLKRSLSPSQLIDLVSMKSKMNKRRLKAGLKVNESNYTPRQICRGFNEFYDNYLDDSQQEMIDEVFNVFVTGSSEIKEKILTEIIMCIENLDKEIANFAN